MSSLYTSPLHGKGRKDDVKLHIILQPSKFFGRKMRGRKKKRLNVEGEKDVAYSDREGGGDVERTALAGRKAVAGREKGTGKQGERP